MLKSRIKKRVLCQIVPVSCVMAAVLGILGLCMARLSAQTKPGQVKSVRLYVMDLGKLEDTDTTSLGYPNKADLATTDLSIVSYLIVHPKGTLIWDTGVQRDRVGGPGFEDPAPGNTPGHTFVSVAGKTNLRDQLAQIGYSEKDITYLAMSHMHGDHTANSNAFAGSTWFVQQPEWEAMFPANPTPRDVERGANWSELKNSKTIILRNVDPYDVFGDGTVLIKPAYGHTPGLQVLMVHLKETGWVALVGDLYHYPEDRGRRTTVPSFEYNKDESIASRNRIEDYVQKMGAQMWIEHDYLLHQKLKKSPAYYQ